MIKYVVGFAFSEDKKQVIMIQKEHPDWQKGKLNGVGGKADQQVEETERTRAHIETPYEAMVREFEEETGVKFEHWECYAICEDRRKDITMYCYRIFTDRIIECKTMSDEVIKVCSPPAVITLGPPHTLSNIPFLLAMAMDRNIHDAQITVNLDQP
ncbi:MAG: NUDIX domain-containing protein [Methanobacteriota archaeon]|nr:MAG: NUDIX domain-containing protein [Euryarchaeota archaeon]